MKVKRVAVTTGGVRRLGRQIAYHLAGNGYRLAVIYNSSPANEIKNTSEHLKKLPCEAKFYKCDVSDLKQLKRTIDRIGKDYKKIDLLVNNSGVINKIDFENITQELFDKTMNVNLRAPLFTTQFALRYLIKSSDPVVINIASLGGLLNWSGYIPYSISKSGLIKLTALLARKLAPRIRVNAIAPGTIIIDGEEDGAPEKTTIEKIPLRKYGKPKDILDAVDFILNCEYLTGQVITVDGGRAINN